MRRCFGYLLMFFCIVLGYFIKLLQNSEDLSDFPTIKLYNINDFAMETAAISLTNAIKKRFQPDSPEIPLNNRTNSPVLQTYKSKFSKVSRNFLINSTQTAKTVLTLANNYLGNNRTNSQKTGNFSLFSLNFRKELCYFSIFPHNSSIFADFLHEIPGIIVGVASNSQKTQLAVAIASRSRDYFLRIYQENRASFANFCEIALGPGNLLINLAIEGDLLVFYRLFDEGIFSTLSRFFEFFCKNPRFLIKLAKLCRKRGEWRNISSVLTFKYSNRTVFQTIGLRFVGKNSKNQQQLLSFCVM